MDKCWETRAADDSVDHRRQSRMDLKKSAFSQSQYECAKIELKGEENIAQSTNWLAVNVAPSHL